ncbi:hypothetical protein LTR15_004516 [Elasticomyces elasticus]|nr:hypothetical protein LTR15_004516 [Elasticomyces elasticus]
MADTEPPTKRRRVDFSETLCVLVGEDKKAFTVHKDIITTRSPYFSAAASARWNSASHKDITLAHDKPAIFSEYLQCLYLSIVETDGKLETDIFDLYLLADKLGDLVSANVVMDCIINWYAVDDVIPTVKAIGHVFDNTAPESKLRRSMVDYWVHESNSDAFVEAVTEAAKLGYTEVMEALLLEFGKVVAERCASKIVDAFGQGVGDRAKCHYHQHDEACPPCAAG